MFHLELEVSDKFNYNFLSVFLPKSSSFCDVLFVYMMEEIYELTL